MTKLATAIGFQHTAARRRLLYNMRDAIDAAMFQHTAARRRLMAQDWAAVAVLSFNTQPPEGGWSRPAPLMPLTFGFQHTAARRRLAAVSLLRDGSFRFNTQPPEGGWTSGDFYQCVFMVSTHSRPKAAGSDLLLQN